MGGAGMKIAKVLRVKTQAAAHIVIRNGAGRKLFEMNLPGVCITVTSRRSQRSKLNRNTRRRDEIR
jgi:hypothetical protein